MVAVAGEGTPSGLTVEAQGGASFGTVRVGYALQRTLTLVNQSEGLLRYSAAIVDESEADGDEQDGGAAGSHCSEQAPAAAAGSSSIQAAMADVARQLDSTAEPVVFEDVGMAATSTGPACSRACGPSTSASAGGGSNREAEFWLDCAEGEVGGRSQKTLVLALLPRRRRRYRLRLVISAAPSAAGSISGSGTSEACGTATEAPPPLAELKVEADARFPCVLVTDVACDGMAKQVG